MGRAALLSCLLLSGCYLSHELDDAGTRRDLGMRDARAADMRSDDLGGVDVGRACPFGWDDEVAATITMTADDAYTLWVNGVRVGTDGGGTWHETDTYAISLHRHPSRFNVIAIDAQNLWTVDGRDRGVVLDLRSTVDGVERVWTSGTHFLAHGSVPPAPPPPDAWTEEDYDWTPDSWFRVADEGPHGEMPWGAVLGASDAHWMWSYESNLPASAKIGAEHAYMRSTLVFHADGTPNEDREDCP